MHLITPHFSAIRLGLVSLLLPVCLAGCTRPLLNRVKTEAAAVTLPDLDPARLEVLEVLETAPAASPLPQSALTSLALPSPGRTNPFEMDGEEDEQLGKHESIKQRVIRVTGFVEVNDPTVMLLIDGKAHAYRAGETHQQITVNEISPPYASLTCDSVTWTASMFDR